MHFSQLNNDVILEIFLQFVAIDWDGPFTLMLVCTKWSNLVISQPRVWTWIMVDETQVEWRERMEIGAHLSKNLPLQIVLKIPFESRVSLSHITRRCSTLFLDSGRLDGYLGLAYARSWAKNIIPYETFLKYSGDFKQCHDSLVNFLNDAPTDGIQIRSGNPHYTSFAYSAWHIYERLNQHTRITEVLTSGETLVITALVFNHSESAPLPRTQVLVTDLWGILPLLSNLSYLELADNCIRVPKGTVLANIHLRSLQFLRIKSPMRGSVFFSLEDDVWLGLLGLLDAVVAPKLEVLSLRSPLHRIVASLINCYGRFNLSHLQISISLFDETADRELLDRKLVWHGLRRCIITISEPSRARRHTDSEVMDALRLVFNMIPKSCPVQLDGDDLLEPLMQSELLSDVELHIVTGYVGEVHNPLISRSPHTIRSLALLGEEKEQPTRVPWISSVEELWTDTPALIYPIGPPLPMRVLDCAHIQRPHPEFGLVSTGITGRSFSNLVDLRCAAELAVWMISMNEVPHLRSLTLDDSSLGIPLSDVLGVVESAGHRLLSLATFGFHGGPDWKVLLPFIARFNRSRGSGISTVKLWVLPHPAILSHLGWAFRGETDEPEMLQELFKYEIVQLRTRYPNSCPGCISFGWSCSGFKHCSRFESQDLVTITEYMPLTEYRGDWGPDGLGWEDLSSADERDIDTDTEMESEGFTWEA